MGLSLGGARGLDTNPFSAEGKCVGLAVVQQCERKKSLDLGRKCWIRQRSELEGLPSLQENDGVDLQQLSCSWNPYLCSQPIHLISYTILVKDFTVS